MKSKEELIEYLVNSPNQLKDLQADAQPLWGTMNGWQMVEHLALTYRPSNGKLDMPITTPTEKLDKFKNVGLLSDRPLGKGVDNPLLRVWKAEHPGMLTTNITEAVSGLDMEISDFIRHFNEKGHESKRIHNIFGELNFYEWLWFHYKHTMHHFMQFGLVPECDRIV